jgi:hypothetical protein
MAWRHGQTQLVRNAVFFVQSQAKVEKARLGDLDEAGQGNGGTHIAQRIVRGIVDQAIGAT